MNERFRTFAGFAWLLAAAACSPEAGGQKAADSNVQTAAANVQQSPAPVANVAATNAAVSPTKAASGPARRCGWLHNPTPANWWLVDRDGQWILGTQGLEPAPGMDDLPDMSAGEWVETNGHYGYGCACMTIESDAEGDVLKVSDATSKPLAQCRSDKALPNPHTE